MKNLFFVLFLCQVCLSNAQFVEPKFGKIEPSDLSMTSYDKDTTAGALMLFNCGNASFVLNSDQEFQFLYKKHCQIKIFKKSAFPLADVSIRLYQSGEREEELIGLKAFTYNMVDGKVVKTKVDNGKIYRAEADNYLNVNFAFPEVKEGSIIEFEYSITSDFLYNFRGWNFQYSYPARWSQYTYEIPEYFTYRELSKGYFTFDINKRTKGNVSYSIPTTTTVSMGYDTRTVRGLPTQIQAATFKTTLALKDVPAFISEPNIDCEDNYIQSIQFELSRVKYPGQPEKDYTQSWEAVNEQMIKDEDFGALLKTTGFLKDTVRAVCSEKTSEFEKAVSIYNWVQSRMKWNGYYNLWAMKGLKKPFNDRIGSSSEINLLLTAMLQAAGIKADPVMFSTRSNGIGSTFYPTITNFNSVLTKADIDGKSYLLDAVNKYCPFGVLPAEDINVQGRGVNELGGYWVNLDAAGSYSEYKNYRMELSSDGKLIGSITGSYDDYAGVYYRDALNSEKTSDDYFRKLQENKKGLTIKSYSVMERYNNDKPLADSLVVEVSDFAETIGDKILFNPLMYERIVLNRYTLENRQYPVNYNFPISEVYTFNYTLPVGFQVESLPKSASLSLPDNSISVFYNVQNTGNTIKVEYKRTIKKILFLPDEYSKLKGLYDDLVKKHAEQIILKKIV
jgi:Domain of Unknown Function with PDB structure (DUF3857)/Transglutaminase-like superfamily